MSHGPSSDDTRAELLDRALDLFAAYGYDGVGVQQICAAAGVTKPTLYHHFGSKRGLLERLMEARLEALHAALREGGAAPGDLDCRADGAREATFAFAARERTFYRLYLTLWFAPVRSEAYDVARAFHERHSRRSSGGFVRPSGRRRARRPQPGARRRLSRRAQQSYRPRPQQLHGAERRSSRAKPRTPFSTACREDRSEARRRAAGNPH